MWIVDAPVQCNLQVVVPRLTLYGFYQVIANSNAANRSKNRFNLPALHLPKTVALLLDCVATERKIRRHLIRLRSDDSLQDLTYFLLHESLCSLTLEERCGHPNLVGDCLPDRAFSDFTCVCGSDRSLSDL